MPKKIYYGAHASIAKGIVGALDTIKKAGGNIVQIFISNPNRRLIRAHRIGQQQQQGFDGSTDPPP